MLSCDALCPVALPLRFYDVTSPPCSRSGVFPLNLSVRETRGDAPHFQEVRFACIFCVSSRCLLPSFLPSFLPSLWPRASRFFVDIFFAVCPSGRVHQPQQPATERQLHRLLPHARLQQVREPCHPFPTLSLSSCPWWPPLLLLFVCAFPSRPRQVIRKARSGHVLFLTHILV